jgi:hypothetical protein
MNFADSLNSRKTNSAGSNCFRPMVINKRQLQICTAANSQPDYLSGRTTEIGRR